MSDGRKANSEKMYAIEKKAEDTCMNAVRKKLNDSRGATILMALLLMLVAIMVSVVILAAAVSAAKAIRASREQQQSYLTVSSAAALVRDSILNGSGSYKVEKKEIYSDKGYKTLYEGPTKTETLAEGNFSSVMNDAIAAVMDGSAASYSDKLSIQDADGRYGTVNAAFTLSSTESEADAATYYILTVVVSLADPGEHPCKMTLTMKGREVVQKEYSTQYDYIAFFRPGKKSPYYRDAYQRVTTTSIDWTETSPVISRERVAAK